MSAAFDEGAGAAETAADASDAHGLLWAMAIEKTTESAGRKLHPCARPRVLASGIVLPVARLVNEKDKQITQVWQKLALGFHRYT